MNFYISDLHLLCKNQTKQGLNHDGRPFETVDEMSQYILQRWNTRVTNADRVYILGDIALRGRSNALIALVAQLKGRKVLVSGNHDDTSDYRYQQLFEQILPYAEVEDAFGGKNYKLILQHYPILMWKNQHRGTMHLYGHVHNSIEEDFYQRCLAEMNQSEELSLRQYGGEPIRAINVGACMPWINYEPRTLKEILEGSCNL